MTCRRVNRYSLNSSGRWPRGRRPVRESAPVRPSRREQLAQIAEQPFVRRAMELFDVQSGQFRYTPPEGDAN